MVEHTVPDKNRGGELNAMRYALNEAGDERQTGSRASNARRNGNVTDGKSSEQRARQRNGTVGKTGGKSGRKELC